MTCASRATGSRRRGRGARQVVRFGLAGRGDLSLRGDLAHAQLTERAAEIVITNVGQVGTTPVRWGPDVRVDDGVISVCPVYARTALDVLGVYCTCLFDR